MGEITYRAKESLRTRRAGSDSTFQEHESHVALALSKSPLYKVGSAPKSLFREEWGWVGEGNRFTDMQGYLAFFRVLKCRPISSVSAPNVPSRTREGCGTISVLLLLQYSNRGTIREVQALVLRI